MYYYSFHITDYRASTAHLSNEEDLAYRRLIDMYYDTELPIPVDTQWVAKRLRVDTHVVESVLNDMFSLSADGWRHARCDDEIAHYHQLAQRNRENGKLGGRPRGKANNPGVPKNNPDGSQSEPTGKPTNNHKPTTSNQEPSKKTTAAVAADDPYFDMFWTTYDYKIDKTKAMKSWKKINPDGQLAMKICQAADRYVIATPDRAYRRHPTTWLNNRSWENEVIDKRMAPQQQMTHHQASTLAAARAIFGDERKLKNEHRIIDATPVEAPAGLLGSADL